MPVAPLFFGINSLAISLVLYNAIKVVEVLNVLDIVYGCSFWHYSQFRNFVFTSKSIFLNHSLASRLTEIVLCLNSEKALAF